MFFRRRRARAEEFDLTPMIDVTFQLLIFFLVVMKIKVPENVHQTNLPPESGPVENRKAEAQDFIVLRAFWRGGAMTYEVNVKHGNAEGRDARAIHGGTLHTLMADRADPAHPRYREVFEALVSRMEETARRLPGAKAVELAIAPDTRRSSALQIDETAPWGFVTLAVDACARFNRNRRDAGLEELPLQIKNTSPARA